jgi:hypothetical protein
LHYLEPVHGEVPLTQPSGARTGPGNGPASGFGEYQLRSNPAESLILTRKLEFATHRRKLEFAIRTFAKSSLEWVMRSWPPPGQQ